MTQLKSESQTWHVQNWGTWGWVETILKLIGVGVAVFGLLGVIPSFSFAILLNAKLLAVIVLALMSLMSLFIVTLRFGQREVIGFVYSILSAIGHISALLLTLQTLVEPRYPAVFAALYLLAELVKIQFLRSTGYTEAGRDTKAMLQIPVTFAIAYLLIAVFIWL
jgi:hypothetical protein